MAMQDADTLNNLMISTLEREKAIGHIDVDEAQLSALEDILSSTPRSGNQIYLNQAQVDAMPQAARSHDDSEPAAPCVHRLYYARSPIHEPAVQMLITEQNKQALSRAKMSQHLRKLAEDLWLVDEGYQREAALVVASVARRNSFFARHTMLDGPQVLALMGSKDKNISRAIGRLIKAHQLIALDNNKAFPAFQFRQNGKVQPALLAALPKVARRGIDMLDFCYWLTDESSEVLSVPAQSGSYKGMSFKALMDKAGERQQQSRIYRGAPMDAVIKGEGEIFEALLDKWLSPETYAAQA